MAYKKRTPKRKSANPSGLAKIWPEDIEKHRQAMLAQFRRENPDLHGEERERQRMIFMRKHFYTPMKPPKIFTEVGIAVNDIVQNAIRNGENPKDVLAEIIRYASGTD